MGIFPCLGKQTKECCISCFWHTFFLLLLLSIVLSFACSFSLSRICVLCMWFRSGLCYICTLHLCVCVCYVHCVYVLKHLLFGCIFVIASCLGVVVIGVKKTREGDTWEMSRTTIFNSHFYGFKQTTLDALRHFFFLFYFIFFFVHFILGEPLCVIVCICWAHFLRPCTRTILVKEQTFRKTMQLQTNSNNS